MYVLLSKMNDTVAKTINSKLSKVVERGEELIEQGYSPLIICEESYNQKEGRTDRKFVLEIKQA